MDNENKAVNSWCLKWTYFVWKPNSWMQVLHMFLYVLFKKLCEEVYYSVKNEEWCSAGKKLKWVVWV